MSSISEKLDTCRYIFYLIETLSSVNLVVFYRNKYLNMLI